MENLKNIWKPERKCTPQKDRAQTTGTYASQLPFILTIIYYSTHILQCIAYNLRPQVLNASSARTVPIGLSSTDWSTTASWGTKKRHCCWKESPMEPF